MKKLKKPPQKPKKLMILGDIHGCKEYIDLVPLFLGVVDGLICTGDIGGYGPDSVYCYERMIEFKRRFEARGKICEIVAGNHEEGLLLALKYPSVSDKRGGSKTAQAGFLLETAQLLGTEVFDGNKLDPEKLKALLREDWDDRLKRGNRDVLNPDYFPGLEKKVAEEVAKGVGAVGGLFKATTVRYAIERSLKLKERYVALHERELQLQRAIAVLEFIVDLPKERTFEVDGERITVSHTIYDEAGSPHYVVGVEQLAYMDKVYGSDGKKTVPRNVVMHPTEAFKHPIFDNCDTLFLGHVHSSDEYYENPSKKGKKIIMANSPFPRDGLGTRAPFLFYYPGTGKIERVETTKYDHEETERKLETANPRFLNNQVKLWRSFPRR